ncbi:MAG TPA: hypothetical protein DCW41_03580 [Clostridiales bacterium]|nr:hypothetical protein [Clostridiales bacterium]
MIYLIKIFEGVISMASGFFKQTNPAMRFLTGLCDLMVTNLLFIITCIPVFTIGASLCSLYKIAAEIKRGEEVFLFQDYFKTFASCFKKATLLWVPLLVIDSFLAYELYLLYYVLPEQYQLLQYPIIFVLFISLFIVIYSFPLMALFENSLKGTVINAFKIGLVSFPTTIFIMVMHILIFVLFINGSIVSIVILSIYMFFGFTLTALVTFIFMDKAMDRIPDYKRSKEILDEED